MENTVKRPGKKRVLVAASVASMVDLFNEDNINILLRLGCRVDVAANFQSGSVTSKERVAAYREELEGRGIGVYDIPVPRDIRRVREMWQSYRMMWGLARAAGYDMVHCQSPIGGALWRAACMGLRKRGTAVVYTAHGFHFFHGAGLWPWVAYYPVERFLSRFTDVLITINKEDYRAARKFHAGRAVYVPGVGVHAGRIGEAAAGREEMLAEFGFGRQDFVFMSTGQLSVRKNHEAAIRALGMIRDRRVKYLIVGSGELEGRLRALVKSLGLGGRVAFAGYRADVGELLHCVDAFIFPSLQEGLPVAMMEAMAAGLPIVASRIRGNVDLAGDGFGGYLVGRRDVHGYAKAMGQVIRNRHAGMGERNAQIVKEFDISAVSRRMEKIYRQCI